MPLYHLLYISDASEGLAAGDLEAMVGPFRNKNRGLDVTGVLFYSAGHFIQLLEGPRMPVQRLFDTIAVDARHHNVRRLLIGPAEHRVFREWDMGLLALDDRSPLDRQRLADLMREAETVGADEALPPTALRMLSKFCMMLSGSDTPAGE